MTHRENIDGVVAPNHEPVPAEPAKSGEASPELQAQLDQAYQLVVRRVTTGLKEGRLATNSRVPFAHPADLETKIEGWGSHTWLDHFYYVKILYSMESHQTEQPGVLTESDLYTMYQDKQGNARISRSVTFLADPADPAAFQDFCAESGHRPRRRRWTEEQPRVNPASLDHLWIWMIGAQSRPQHLPAKPAHPER